MHECTSSETWLATTLRNGVSCNMHLPSLPMTLNAFRKYKMFEINKQVNRAHDTTVSFFGASSLPYSHMNYITVPHLACNAVILGLGEM